MAKASLLGYGFLVVAVSEVDHDFFSILAVYPVVFSHFSILTLYALGVTECHIKPTIVINTPQAGSAINNSSFIVSGTAMDNVGILAIQYKLDNSIWFSVTAGEEWTFSTTNVSNGSHVIYMRAQDLSGNYSETASVSINVNAKQKQVIVSFNVINRTVILTYTYNNPLGTSITYGIDKGDGSIFNWPVNDISFYENNTNVSSYLEYDHAGTYTIKVIAKDGLGNVSDWSNPQTIYLQ